jgi:hypothetical protein
MAGSAIACSWIPGLSAAAWIRTSLPSSNYVFEFIVADDSLPQSALSKLCCVDQLFPKFMLWGDERTLTGALPKVTIDFFVISNAGGHGSASGTGLTCRVQRPRAEGHCPVEFERRFNFLKEDGAWFQMQFEFCVQKVRYQDCPVQKV